MTSWKTVLLALFLGACSCFAQSREPDDSWLKQNFRFAVPAAPGEIQPVSPLVAQLQEIQNTILSILRKSDFAWDFEAALAAAAQATANAQMIGAVTGQLPPPQLAAAAPQQPPAPDPARYLIVFRDRTTQVATAVWTDRLMLHYLTPTGAHGQVRLELVDWRRTAELNPQAAAAGWPPAPASDCASSPGPC